MVRKRGLFGANNRRNRREAIYEYVSAANYLRSIIHEPESGAICISLKGLRTTIKLTMLQSHASALPRGGTASLHDQDMRQLITFELTTEMDAGDL